MDNTAAIQNDESFLPAINSLLLKIYMWVILGLIITCGSADLIKLYWKQLYFYVVHNPEVMYTLLSAEVAIAWAFSFFIKYIPRWAAALILLVYALVNGAAMSVIFQFFNVGAAVILFGSAAAMFLVISVARLVFRLDLWGFSGFIVAFLSGTISCAALNLYLHSTTLCWIVTMIGIVIFIGIFLWHRNLMKAWVTETDIETVNSRRTPVYGALILYLEFIIFIFFFVRLIKNG